MIKDLIKKNRSYRRFDASAKIEKDILLDLVDHARLSASASNRQLLRFALSTSQQNNDKIFSCLRWAGYLKNWQGPQPAERPSAYIVILRPHTDSPYIGHDTGIAAQSILLAAVEKGLGGCMFGSVDREKLSELVNLPPEYHIELVIALGKPLEKVIITDAVNNDIKYWRDENEVHYVPKRNLEDLIQEI